MSEKRNLKPRTIVPANLYVARAADRQLDAIVDDMGRPGYVLVARQMGKTNLLLNMKRQRNSDVVLYLDLSNRFDSATSWFRNVIDALLDSYSDQFSAAAAFVDSSRASNSFEASVEYDRHLRYLLRQTDKNVVIILDEIDSLVNTSYSDVILSQIRSMYFSRASHPEYERLTYVLSGVAEPSDLIKDKNISPFNIGEKIYLDNFNLEEVYLFVEKAELRLGEIFVRQLYAWTCGNPRMTWDVCSEIERMQAAGNVIGERTVDEVVERLYLQDFSRAPVDHIRTLVESDVQIRAAIDEVRWGKSEFIDPKMKSRLYLAGIAVPSGKSMTLANRIVDLALNDHWIAQVSDLQIDPVIVASESYLKGNYSTSVEQFEKILLGLKDEQDFSSESRKRLGLAYLYSGAGDKAIGQLLTCLTNDLSLAERQETEFFVAVAYGAQGKWKDALTFYEKAQGGPDQNYSQRARLEIVHVLIELGVKTLWERAVTISNALVTELENKYSSNQADPVIRQRLTAALHYRAWVMHLLKRKPLVSRDVDRARQVSGSDVPPSVLLLEHEITISEIKRAQLISLACKIIISREIRFGSFDDLTTQLTDKQIINIFRLLNKYRLDEEFDDLLDYYSSKKFAGLKSRPSILIDLCLSWLSAEESLADFVPLLRYVLEKYGAEASYMDSLTAYRLLALNAPEKNKREYINDYLDQLEKMIDIEEPFFDLLDFTTLLFILVYFKQNKLSSQFKRMLELWMRFKPKVKSIPNSWSIYIQHFEMDLYKETGAIRQAQIIAKQIIEYTEKNRLSDEFQGMDMAYAISARRAAATFLGKKVSGSVPLRQMESDLFKGIGRNQILRVAYADGVTVSRKFKNVEGDLRNSLCRIVEVESEKLEDSDGSAIGN